jgi:hypothetical protein
MSGRLTRAQRRRRARVETAIRLAAPALDLLLFAGDRLSRVAGRNQPEVEPPARRRTPIGGPPVQG